LIEDLRQKLLRQVRFLESELADSGHFAALTHSEYLTDSDRRRNVERWTENILNSLIDTAKIALTIEKVPLGDSYREIVESLAAVQEFAELDMPRFAVWTRFRNVLAHEYLDVRWRTLERFIVEAPPECQAFLDCSKRYLVRISDARS
jgi:uncharacterized protein YutE (UPF0331/DUF86 family)